MFAAGFLEFPVSLSVAAKARIANPGFQDWGISIVKGIAFLADLALAAHACDKLSIAGPADCHENRLFAYGLKAAVPMMNL